MASITNEEKKKKKVSNSYIPDDVAFSILSKLPIKSVQRFSCVRKSWSLLFQNSYFRKILLSKSHPLYDDSSLNLNQFLPSDGGWNFYLFSGHKFENKVKLKLPPPFHNQQKIGRMTLIHILGSAINNTLCIYNSNYNRDVVLWNPTTDQVKVIPPSIDEFFSNEIFVSLSLHGFGYDHVRDDYKVIQCVKFITYNNEYPWYNMTPDPYWEIYSLKSNTWTKLDFCMPIRYQFTGFEVYLNGFCHWWGKRNNKTYLVSFDLCNEVYFSTPSPIEDVCDCFETNLIVLNGSVAMISSNEKTTSFHISILGEFGVKESWIRLFDVEPLSYIDHPIPIGAGKKDNIFFRKENDELACFDLTTEVVEEIGVKGEKFRCQMTIYKNNFIPIGGIDK